MIITSRTNQKIKELLEIKSNKTSFFLVEGYHLVEMAYNAKRLVEIICLDGEKKYQDIKRTFVSKDILEKLATSKTPQGIIGVCKKDNLVKPLGNKVLVLDNVQDPGNVGTLLRTALSFNYLDVICLDGTSSIYNEKTISSSQGAIFNLNIIKCSKEEALAKLDSYLLIGSSLHNAISLSSYKKEEKPFALFLGNEGQGMSKDLLKRMDVNLKIEIENIDSLNVAIAGGILMYNLK